LEGFRSKDVALVKKVIQYLPQQLFQNGAYCRGPVRTKEAHCYTFDSSVGKIKRKRKKEKEKERERKKERMKKRERNREKEE